jgi:hypothetical protein
MTTNDDNMLYSLEPETSVVRPPDPVVDADESITRTAAIPEPKCPTCGYIVIGLTSGVCPECGGRINWRAVVEAPERRRLARQALFDVGIFWLGVAMNAGAIGRLYWAVGGSKWLFFLVLTPYLLTAGIWLTYRAANGDEMRWPLFWTGLIASSLMVAHWAKT